MNKSENINTSQRVETSSKNSTDDNIPVISEKASDILESYKNKIQEQNEEA